MTHEQKVARVSDFLHDKIDADKEMKPEDKAILRVAVLLGAELLRDIHLIAERLK